MSFVMNKSFAIGMKMTSGLGDLHRSCGDCFLRFTDRWASLWRRAIGRKTRKRLQQDAKKEGAIVVGIPARAELRKQMEAAFKPKFGIDMDLSTARGPQNASRIAAEYAAGVKNFDVFIGGSGAFESLVEGGMVEPLDALMLLPEVKKPSNGGAGNIWEDNLSGNRHLYSFIAEAGTGGLWFNTEVAKPNELRSFDDLLNPKWKGKIGFLDPRTPGSGQSVWSYLWDEKRRAVFAQALAARSVHQP